MNNEPVAWMSADGKFNKKETWYFPIPLYNHPVKELTDEEIMAISETFEDRFVDTEQQWSACILDFAKAILRKAQKK